MSGSVGPAMAGCLDWPSLMGVVSLQWGEGGNGLVGERELEGGILERFHIASPCVVGIQSGRLTPRYPSLGRMLAARKAALSFVDPIPLEECGVCMGEKRPPDPVRNGELWQGGDDKTAGKLNLWLRERQFI